MGSRLRFLALHRSHTDDTCLSLLVLALSIETLFLLLLVRPSHDTCAPRCSALADDSPAKIHFQYLFTTFPLLVDAVVALSQAHNWSPYFWLLWHLHAHTVGTSRHHGHCYHFHLLILLAFVLA